MENSMVILDECDEVKEERLVHLQGLRLGFFRAMPLAEGCSSWMKNSMNLGDENKGESSAIGEESSVIRHSHSNSRVSHDILPLHQDDDIREESSVVRHSHSNSRESHILPLHQGDVITEDNSVIRHSHSNSRGSHDVLPLHQARSDQALFNNTTPPCNSSLKILIPSLLVLVAVKCQLKSLDPFVTYPQQTWSFVVAIFAYCLILWALKQSQNESDEFLQFLRRVGLASGVLSSLSLVSPLLPHIPGLLLLYASWALSTIISAIAYASMHLYLASHRN